jgi:hypothetical protein
MLVRAVLSFAAISTLTAVSAFASDWRVGNLKVPFAFRAGSTTMPAGNYEIEAPHGRTVPMLTFRNVDSGDVTTVLAPIALSSASSAVDPSMARVDFLCAGTECAFYKLWPSAYAGGWSVVKPKFKNQLGQSIPAGELKVATVIVPMRSSD